MLHLVGVFHCKTKHHLWALSSAIILLLFAHLLLFLEAVFGSFLYKILYEILVTPFLFKSTWSVNSNVWSFHINKSVSFLLRIILHYAIKDQGHFSLHLWVVQYYLDSSKSIRRRLPRIAEKARTTGLQQFRINDNVYSMAHALY